jgi:hypothetical protein
MPRAVAALSNSVIPMHAEAFGDGSRAIWKHPAIRRAMAKIDNARC